jgi:transposase InsO family protein
MLEVLQTGEMPTHLTEEMKNLLESEKPNFLLQDGSLYRLHQNAKIPFIPFAKRADLVASFHHSNGHMAPSSLTDLILQRYWWPSIKSDIPKWIRECAECQLHGKSSQKNQEELHPLPVRYIRPFSRWGIDFIGALPKTTKGNRWLLVAIDYCTKWPIARATKSATAETVAEFIENEIILNFGVPDEIVSDRGPAFNSATIEALLESYRIKHLMSSAYHPRTNGVAERYNAVIGKMIAKYSHKNRATWDLYVNTCLLASRIRLHKSTGFSPFYLVYGCKVKIPGDPTVPIIMKELDEYDSVGTRLNEINQIQEHRKLALNSLEQQRNYMKSNFDKNLPDKKYILKEGDFVLVRNEAPKKLQTRWFGPVRILHIFPNGLYEVVTLKNEKWPYRIHHDRLKPATLTQDLIDKSVLPTFKKDKRTGVRKG